MFVNLSKTEGMIYVPGPGPTLLDFVKSDFFPNPKLVSENLELCTNFSMGVY